MLLLGSGNVTHNGGGWTDPDGRLTRVRAWSEALPFATGAFDAAFCKGSLDHFDDPSACISELSRVTRSDGRVVLAVVNMDSLGCRMMSRRDRVRRRRARTPGRRHYDAPPDHLTRYDAGLLREHAAEHLDAIQCRGVSLLWGIGWWAGLLGRLSPGLASRLLRGTDRLARRLPSLADVVVVSGRPRR